jgi:hypothetical protein
VGRGADAVRLAAAPAREPIRVTSPEEAEAAQQRILERAASVGANGLVFVDEGTPEGGLRRNVVAVFVRADSARSYKACGK